MTDFVPASEKDITASWLANVLAESYPVLSASTLECKRIGEAYGFASRLFRLSWKEKHQAKSVIIKLWKVDSKAGTSEISFYETFRPVGVRTPAFLYGAQSSENAVLILEDLSEAEQGDVLKPLDLDRAKNLARKLAALHSKWLDHPYLKQTWLNSHVCWRPNANWIQERRSEFLERFPNHLSQQARQLLEQLELAVPIVNERLSTATPTLLHGDFHLDNLLFDKQEPIFLDWSKPIKGAASLNLAQLLFLMTSTKHFNQVLNSYTNEYQKQTKLNPEQLEQQISASSIQLFSYLSCGIARWQPTLARAKQIIEDDIARADHMIQFWHKRNPALFSFIN